MAVFPTPGSPIEGEVYLKSRASAVYTERTEQDSTALVSS